MKKADATACQSGRYFAAWIGLTPKDHSTAGRRRLGGITRAGDPALRSVLVVGAMAVIRQAERNPEKAAPWLLAMLKRKPKKVVAVALANKNARIAWKMMMTGERYDPEKRTAIAIAAAA
jgi:transposase